MGGMKRDLPRKPKDQMVGAAATNAVSGDFSTQLRDKLLWSN